MAKLIKTTILIPKDVLMAAKIRAVEEGTSLSKLITKKLLETTLPSKRRYSKEEAMKTLGTLSIGIKRAYGSRDEIYNEMLGIK